MAGAVVAAVGDSLAELLGLIAAVVVVVARLGVAVAAVAVVVAVVRLGLAAAAVASAARSASAGDSLVDWLAAMAAVAAVVALGAAVASAARLASVGDSLVDWLVATAAVAAVVALGVAVASVVRSAAQAGYPVAPPGGCSADAPAETVVAARVAAPRADGWRCAAGVDRAADRAALHLGHDQRHD